MQESKQETQFRIGGHYRQLNGEVVRLKNADAFWLCSTGEVAAVGMKDGYQIGARRMSDGAAYPYDDPESEFTLIPGELHQVDGQWVPLDAAEDDGEHADPTGDVADMRDSPNAAMIARDGPAKPNGKPILPGQSFQFFAAPAAKPPIAGLTRVSAQDHRVGGWGFVR